MFVKNELNGTVENDTWNQLEAVCTSGIKYDIYEGDALFLYV